MSDPINVVIRSVVVLIATLGSVTAAQTTGGLFQPWVALPSGSFPHAVAIGAVNGDGLNDVVLVTGYRFDPSNDSMLHVWTQNPDGTLAPRVKYPIGGWPESVAIGDVNGDGLNDVVVGVGPLTSNPGIGVFTQNCDGTLNPMVFYPTEDSRKVRLADLNNDGRLDVVGSSYVTGTVSVLLQNEDGTLAAPVRYSLPSNGVRDLKVGDVNNDGLTDVIVTTISRVFILYQKSNGTLGDLRSLVLPNASGYAVGVGDINGDGLNDVVVSYGDNRPRSFIASYLQNSSGGMDPVVSYPTYDIPGPVEVADVNGDGRQDVVVAHNVWLALGVHLQQPDGTLGPEQLYPIPYSLYDPHGLAVGDINGDGITDVVIADSTYGVLILYGTGAPE